MKGKETEEDKAGAASATENDGHSWLVGYSCEASKAFRAKVKDPLRKKQYTSDFVFVEGSEALDAVTARCRDGFCG